MAEPRRSAADPAARIGASTRAQLVVDAGAVCLEASLGASRLLGRGRTELIGIELAELFEPAASERFAHVWEAFREAGGEAAPFALRPPAAGVQVTVAVTALDADRRLVRLEPVAAAVDETPAAGGARVRKPSAREREVLALLAGGATDGQIAARLGLSPATVQTHVRNAKAKLGARTRAQAVAIAIQQGLIESG